MIKIPKRLANDWTNEAGIDGDVIVYRIGFACQKNIYTIDYEGEKSFEGKTALNQFCAENSLSLEDEELNLQMKVVAEPVENALHSVNLLVDEICERTQSNTYQVYLTGEGNFREEVAVTVPYKGNRTAAKPVHYQAIRDHLVKAHGAKVINGMEADDQLAIDLTANPDNYVICSIDKDLRMVPGWHYDFVKQERIYVNEDEGMKSFYKQLLTGDRVDNIIGLKGVGPAKADKILDGCTTEGELFDAACVAYMAAKDFETDEEAMHRMAENASLLWMKRHPDDEYEFPTTV